MKKGKGIFIIVFLVVSTLVACNSSTLSFSEIENVPNHVQDLINSDLKLQLINDGKKGSYIIFHSNGDVESDLVTQKDTVTIEFNVLHPQDDNEKQNVYYLTMDKNHDVIDVLVNGESTPFDEVAGY